MSISALNSVLDELKSLSGDEKRLGTQPIDKAVLEKLIPFLQVFLPSLSFRFQFNLISAFSTFFHRFFVRVRLLSRLFSLCAGGFLSPHPLPFLQVFLPSFLFLLSSNLIFTQCHACVLILFS